MRGRGIALAAIWLLAASTAACAGSSPSAGAAIAAAPTSLTIVAQDFVLRPAEIHLRAGVPTAVTFENHDAEVPHALELRATDAAGTRLATTDIVTGPTTVPLTFDGLIPGRYRFTCPVHPMMEAVIVVEPS